MSARRDALKEFVGRRAERETVEKLLDRAQSGRSGALLVRGEAGIGKTALMEHAREAAASAGFRVEASIGVEAEAQFAFAGLHQLCGPLLDRLEALPDPQQAALGVAFGLRAGPAPDRFLVGLAALSLVAEVAEEAPLLCLVDDVQWLDEASAQVLAFVARRLAAERAVLVFGVRDSDALVPDPFAGLPEVHLAGLDDADALSLLAGAVRTPLDDVVRDRILAEARGNPLALLELPDIDQSPHLAGGYEPPDATSISHRLEDGFRRRLAHLPGETQLLLLVAAAEPTGDVATLLRAADELGIRPAAAVPAEAAGLLEIDSRVRFRHPLVRSAAYRSASAPDRRRAHRALAVATDPGADPDRHAWHHAQSVLGSDARAAAQLESSAERAEARGGVAAAAAFLKRASELTPDPATRAGRALDAAHLMHQAGRSEASLELLAVATLGPLGPLQRARLELLRAQVEFFQTRDSATPRALLDAARELSSLDAGLARFTYLQALDAAIIIGPSAGNVRDIAEAVLAAPVAARPPTPLDLLLEGLATTYTQGPVAGAPVMRRALEPFRGAPGDSDAEDPLSRLVPWLATRSALALFDDELVHVIATRNVQVTREAGALATLPGALLIQSMALVLEGEFARAGEIAAEQATISQATGGVPMHHDRLMLAAWRGHETETDELHRASLREAAGREGGTEATLAEYIGSVLHNGLRNYATAAVAAARACAAPELGHSSIALPELVEAAVRSGRPEQAAVALEELDCRARASGTAWGSGLAARSRALTSTGPDAEDHYREAIELLGACRIVTHLARTHLVYGEWLRREGRRQDAREQLRTAHELLSDMGAEAFAARAARELRATGEHPRKRTAQRSDALTAQEAHIARLVSTGATSREVAAQLFLSPRTIEAHLRNIFRKLDITSRRQLKEMQLP